MEIWEIVIYGENGPAYTILGEEDILKAELLAWQQYQRKVADEFEDFKSTFGDTYESTLGFEIRTVEGFSRDIGRFPMVLGYRFNEVQGMTVMRVR